MPSMDVVSKPNLHEVENALEQARKELATRFDFKDTGAASRRSRAATSSRPTPPRR